MTFKSFDEFYPYYLEQHKTPANKVMHFIAGTFFIFCATSSLVMEKWLLIPVIILVSYLFAWVGHFVFEKNRPATFGHPFYSLRGEFKMYLELLTGKRKFL